MSEAVLRVKDLRTHFQSRAGVLKAVDGVSFEVDRGRILGLVGESGSGKSVTGYSILGLIEPPGMIAGGEVLLNGQDITRLKGPDLRKIRGAQIAMVFQDPMMTLNPVLKIGTQMIAAVRAHDNVSRKAARARAREGYGVPRGRSPYTLRSPCVHRGVGHWSTGGEAAGVARLTARRRAFAVARSGGSSMRPFCPPSPGVHRALEVPPS